MSADAARRIWFLQEASEDVAAAFEWYEDQRVGLGSEFVQALDMALMPVLGFPLSCEVFYRDTRRCLIERFPFEVFYRVEDELIVVVACMHAARDPEAILKRVGG